MIITNSDALIVVDVQNDFCPGGALPVPGGDAIVPTVNGLMRKFAQAGAPIVLTQDWHPLEHRSFAYNNPGRYDFDTIRMPYGDQVLWPVHCVQGTDGADFHPSLRTEYAHLILRKGGNPEVDSYSAFFENDRTTATGLEGYLAGRHVTRIFVAGLALDFCVAYTALDATKFCTRVFVVDDACRAIDLNGSLERARDRFIQYKVYEVPSEALK